MLFIGCSTNAFYPQLDAINALAEIGSRGFTHAGLMLHHQRQYCPSMFRECRKIATSAGVQITGLHLQPEMHLPFAPEQVVVADAWRNFDAAIDGAHEIGAPFIVWQGPLREVYPVELGCGPLLEVIYELNARCQAAGIKLALEHTSAGLLATLRDFLEITPRLPLTTGFAFDSHHASAAHTNPMLLLRQMTGRVVDVHLRDFDEEGCKSCNLLPGEGTLPWSAILRAVRGAGFDGAMMLETSLYPDPTRSLAAVHKLLDPIMDLVNAGEQHCDSTPPPGVLEGIRLFNEGMYYECHEEIEHEWHAEKGEIRNLYQGILQIGVGFYHASSGNLRGASLLLTDGLEKLSCFLPACLGIDTQRLWNESMAVLAAIRGKFATQDPAPLVLVFPTIRFL